eukprot:scaffold67_cov192-Alexandrium_tamarense.AAC.42
MTWVTVDVKVKKIQSCQRYEEERSCGPRFWWLAVLPAAQRSMKVLGLEAYPLVNTCKAKWKSD